MSAGVLSYLRRLLPTAEAQLPDGELLRRFGAGEHAAFTELLRRHGPLVWGVCRRVLGDAHAAEDAFQATFLQLSRRIGALRGDGSLAGWLHTVATRLARRAWLAERRRRRRDRTYTAVRAPADELSWRELRQLLDTEIARLPEPYRQPLILCYLDNQPHSEAARRLGLTPSVLRGRLERGRQKLRRRLEKLGLPLAAALLLTKAEPVPAMLGETTHQTVRSALAGGPVPRGVASLAAGGTLLGRIKFRAVALALLTAGGFGIGGAARQAERSVPPPSKEPPAQARPAVDALGDPLPPGALRRLGTSHHRVQNWPLHWQNLPDGKSYLAHQQLGPVVNAIRRLDAGTGRVLETWPLPYFHHAAGFSADGRYVLLSNPFVHTTGAVPLGQNPKWQWKLTLHDLVKRETVWENSEYLEENEWKSVDSACFSTDDKWIATTGQKGRDLLRLWDAMTGKELWNRKQDEQSLELFGFRDGGATLVLRERKTNSIHLIDRATGKQLRSFPTMTPRQTHQCGLAPDGSAVLFGTHGPTVRVWDVATGRERPSLDGHKQPARCFAFSPDGQTVVTGGNDTFVRVRAWPSGRVVRTIDLGRGRIERMAIFGDGRQLTVLFGGEQALHFYDLKTGKELPSPRESHKAGVYGVAVVPDGKLLSFSNDATIRTWDPATGKALGQRPAETSLNAGGFTVSGDGRLLATTSGDRTAILVYERATGKQVRKLPAERTAGEHRVFSPDGRWLAAVDPSQGAVQVWDVTHGRSVLKCSLKVVYGITCTFSPDGRQFAAADHGLVRFWDTGAWKEQTGLPAFAPLGLAYSPDGRTLATASVEGVRLFELATRRERAHIPPVGGYPQGTLAFSHTGRCLSWTGNNRAVFVWDVHRGETLGSFTGHDDTVTGLAFTADDCVVVSSSEDWTLLVWDVAGTAAKKPPRKPGDVNRAWQTLAGDDAKAAYEAICALASSPDAAVALLARHLQGAVPIDAKRIDACLHDLDSDQFAIRERAMRELEQWGDQTQAALERFLAGRPSLEARRRVEQLLEKAREVARDPERLRQLRALEALEWMGGGAARRLMEALAKGAPDSLLTHDARAALARMRH